MASFTSSIQDDLLLDNTKWREDYIVQLKVPNNVIEEAVKFLNDCDKERIQYRKEELIFQTPFDVLLHLIEEKKLNIKNVKVSDIITQYIQYVRALQYFDLDVASDFIRVGAELLILKAKEMQPDLEWSANNFEYEDDYLDYDNPYDCMQSVANLSFNLQLYNLTKQISTALADKQILKRYFREPELEAVKNFTLVNFSKDKLINAYKKQIKMEVQEARSKKFTEKHIDTTKYSIEERIRTIFEGLLERNRQFKFSSLFDKSTNKSEIIASFLASLSLCKEQALTLTQVDDNDILLKLRDGVDKTRLLEMNFDKDYTSDIKSDDQENE